jgi:hypothetical protein
MGTIALLALAALAQDVALAEIEVARGEKPKARSIFHLDDPADRYDLRDAWGEGQSPLLTRPAKAFGAMSREQARAWALDVVKASFDHDLSDLSNPETGPDTVDKGDGKKIPTGWGLDLLQSYKGAVFYDPDAPGDRAGVLAWLSDDLSGQAEGPATAHISLRLWAVRKEHGPAKKPVAETAATAAPLKDFVKTHPAYKGVKLETEAVLCWAVKPGAADRRIPIWHVTLEGPPKNLGKPLIQTYRVDAWTGTIVSTREVAIPRAPPPPTPAPPKK